MLLVTKGKIYVYKTCKFQFVNIIFRRIGGSISGARSGSVKNFNGSGSGKPKSNRSSRSGSGTLPPLIVCGKGFISGGATL
jgi:hypothetical protein